MKNGLFIKKSCNVRAPTQFRRERQPQHTKGALSALRQFLATENPSKMMKNDFSFRLKRSFHSQDI